jgi:hypothetical protein
MICSQACSPPSPLDCHFACPAMPHRLRAIFAVVRGWRTCRFSVNLLRIAPFFKKERRLKITPHPLRAFASSREPKRSPSLNHNPVRAEPVEALLFLFHRRKEKSSPSTGSGRTEEIYGTMLSQGARLCRYSLNLFRNPPFFESGRWPKMRAF